MKKHSILFVDDELHLIHGLKRAFYSCRDKWNMFFALSGEEALELMKNNNIDVIVSDMKMPIMDGAELLNRVKELYPQTIRIILSGHSDEGMILRSTKSSHQFVPKPCDPDVLKNAIEKSLILRDLLKDENLIKIVSGITVLPSLPDLYYKVIEELNKEDPSLLRVGKIISQDISMTAKILQLVNSAFFGLPQRITNPQQAVNLLGLDTIKALIISIGIFSSFSKIRIKDFSLESLWEHSMQVGYFTKQIMTKEFTDKKKTEDCMIAGLLHDIGKLLMIQIEGYTKKMNNLLFEKDICFVDAEYEIFGVSHAEVGAYLLGLWNLPDVLIESTAFHHYPSKLNEKSFTLVGAIHISNAFLQNTKEPEKCLESRIIDRQYIEYLKLHDKMLEWKNDFINFQKKGIKNET